MNDTEDLLNWPADFHACLARFQRYRTTNANLLAKHRKALGDYRKNRRTEAKASQTQTTPNSGLVGFCRRANLPKPRHPQRQKPNLSQNLPT
jgi:hypothetical protein